MDPLRLWIWNPLLLLLLAWCVQALLVLIQAGKFVRRIHRQAPDRYETYRPPVTLIVPFKGFDHDLQRGIRALLTLDYPDYRLLAVVESEQDPAHAVLRETLASFPAGPGVEIVVAGLAPDDTGQKVHNQLAAFEHLERQPRPLADTDVVVFADSDAVPHARWLAQLVGPLLNEKNGVTTGYRWLIPQLRAQRPRWGSVFASIINSGVATFIGHGSLTQAWGGSMAMRAGFLREAGLADHFRGALSDDYQVTRLCREHGRRVSFVHHCLVPSGIDLSMGPLFEFGRRQYLITRVHDPLLYVKAVCLAGGYLLAVAGAWVGGVLAWYTGYTGVALCAAGAIGFVFVANQYRATLRRRAVSAAFGPTMAHHLRRTLAVDRLGTTLVAAVNLLLLLTALSSRRITWRGVNYELRGPQDVRASRPEPEEAAAA